MLSLEVSRIKDDILKENFSRINDFIKSNPILSGQFELIEFNVRKATVMAIRHGLGFVPRDVIPTYASGDLGGATLVWQYWKFTKNNIYVDVTPDVAETVTVRAFVGRYEKGLRG